MKTRKLRTRQLNAEQRDWIIRQIAIGKKYADIAIEFVEKFSDFAPDLLKDELVIVIAARCKDIKRKYGDEVERIKLEQLASSADPPASQGRESDLDDCQRQEIERALRDLKREEKRLRQAGQYSYKQIIEFERARKSLYTRHEALKQKKGESSRTLFDDNSARERSNVLRKLIEGNRLTEEELELYENNPEDREPLPRELRGKEKELHEEFVALAKEWNIHYHYSDSADLIPYFAIKDLTSAAINRLQDSADEPRLVALYEKYPLLFELAWPPFRPRGFIERKSADGTVNDAREAGSPGTHVPASSDGVHTNEKSDDTVNSDADPANVPVAVPSSNGAHAKHTVKYEKKAIPEGYIEDMEMIDDSVQGVGELKIDDAFTAVTNLLKSI